ncbi:MAG: HPr family phosphocarrier protein [Collinsella sp.]|nr:HPr family phosphocarrier protein [Collinsella sp.]
MVTFSYTVRGAMGLHARPVAELSAAARAWESEIWIAVGARRSSARDLMGLMELDAHCGDELAVSVAGPDEEAAAAALREVLTF